MAETDAKDRQEGAGEARVPEAGAGVGAAAAGAPEAAGAGAEAPGSVAAGPAEEASAPVQATSAEGGSTPTPAASAEAASAAEEAASAGEAGTGAEEGEAAGGAQGPDLAAEVAALRAELEAARAEARRNLEGWARAQAELENYRKRAQREKEESIQYEIRRLLQSFLPVLDNLERALAVPEGADASSLRTGVELTVRQFREALARHGVEAIPVQPGDPFDPAVHEVLMQVEGDSEEPVVAEVLQGGFRMGDRVIRPALVKVARKGA
ncbi:MAG: nucleotide exchange factor GrpE [Bacillota bacterium]|nr:MAG: nucleotide exchange factor GrpE [Bacillota bacterium]